MNLKNNRQGLLMPIEIIDGDLYIIKKEKYDSYAVHNGDLELYKYLYKNTDAYMDVNHLVIEAIEYEKQEITL